MKQKNSDNAVLEEEHCTDRYRVKNINGKKMNAEGYRWILFQNFIF